jgi:hypothetical protein
VKRLLLALSAAGIAVIIFSLVSLAWLTSAGSRNVEAYDQDLAEPYDGGISHASLALEAAAGRYVIEDTTSRLIDASMHSTLGQYSLERHRVDDAEHVRIKFNGAHRGWMPGRFANTAFIKLNTNPVWRMDIGVGAATVDVDLSPYKTESVVIDAGAAAVKVKLGAHVNETRVKIHAGVSSIRVAVPATAGCEVRVGGGLSSKNIKGFEKINPRTYRTGQFDEAAQKIFVDVDAGLSSIHVIRY